MTQNTKSGFTLIELLVVISVLGIIAAFVVARLSSADKIARDLRRKSDLNQYRLALECYSAKSGAAYPIRASISEVSFPTDPLCVALTGVTMNCIVECPADPRLGVDGQWYRYQSNNTGLIYILWAKLEKSSSSYWYVCSNGVAKEKTSEPVTADCGF